MERSCPYGIKTNDSPRVSELRQGGGGKTNTLLGGGGGGGDSYGGGGSGYRSEPLSDRIQGFGASGSSSSSDSTLQSISSQFSESSLILYLSSFLFSTFSICCGFHIW